jgi:hypothetical protein
MDMLLILFSGSPGHKTGFWMLQGGLRTSFTPSSAQAFAWRENSLMPNAFGKHARQ